MNRKRDLTAAIHSQGRRLTYQRKLVLEILEESAGKVPPEHLDAESLYERARKRNERIGMATVYRTLAFLKEIGLVDEHQFGEDHGHFEAVQDNRPHHHFTCINCGRVIEFQSPQVMEMARKLCENEGMQVVEVKLHARGYCADCRPEGEDCGQGEGQSFE
jgi:Fur family transcriptional regulator, ferric uptake regulator